MRLFALMALVLWSATGISPVAASPPPPPLSHDSSPVNVDATYGSGAFGRWIVDGLGLPAYRYEIDPDTDPRAVQPELHPDRPAGNRDAWHQLGNDRVVATAHNRGYVQLWSQDRVAQWTNRAEPGNGHHAGGYGYLRLGDRTISTLYADRPQGATTERDFGAGYFRRRTVLDPVDIEEHVYAPFGDDPLLLHDVTIRNTSAEPFEASWFEYWDVNPYKEFSGAADVGQLDSGTHRGLAAPTFDEDSRTLSVEQRADGRAVDPDADPLSIFAAALRGPVDGFETDARNFFGDGGRADPYAVETGRLASGIASPVAPGSSGKTLFAFRAPVALPPGESVTLRYAYGTAHAEEIPGLVEDWRAAEAPLQHSQRQWADWLPRAELEGDRAWLQRELQWAAYMVRSGTTYEELCGHHIVSQGGYYQYDTALQIAFRDPLQHILPLIYAEPEIVREVLRYSARQQPQPVGRIQYGMAELCTPFEFGNSNDLDLWLLFAAAEYGLASRDLTFFDEQVPWVDGGEATLWQHLKAAHRHQETQRGPHGGYLTDGQSGDWSDFSAAILPMSESMLVSAQLTYIYPRLAELAEARGDQAFAAELRDDAAELRDIVRNEWTGAGWFSRGYDGNRQLGQGVIFGEPQPWALLGGVTTPEEATTLVANIRRFLTGIDAPPETRGPALIGSSQSPARNDPDVTERSAAGGNNAVYVGDVWYAVNGWLTWALGEMNGVVPNAGDYALDELERNTLAAHAAAYPDHWSGVISVDDTCSAHYQEDPHRCGISIASGAWNTQILHQPAWLLFDTIKLAGVHPVGDGYRIDPSLPMRSFSLRLPTVGVAVEPGERRGYVRPEGSGSLAMRVRVPEGADRGRALRTYVEGRQVTHRVEGGFVHFDLPTRAGEAADWAVTFPPGQDRRPAVPPRDAEP